MIAWWELLLLSVVQGIAEFLPISSSGHLVVLESWLGISADVTDLNIVLHAGTLLAILVVYRTRILAMLLKDRWLLGLVIVGTVPAVVVGLGVKLFLESWLESPLLAGVCLPITGLMLLWCDRHKSGEVTCAQLSWKGAFGIGCAQALAILPGISRSGATIAAGLVAGLNRTEAATFSFLLAIPALSGAAVLELMSIVRGAPLQTPLVMLGVGAGVAAVVGVLALFGLLKILNRGSLRIFGVWCVLLGSAVVIWQLL